MTSPLCWSHAGFSALALFMYLVPPPTPPPVLPADVLLSVRLSFQRTRRAHLSPASCRPASLCLFSPAHTCSLLIAPLPSETLSALCDPWQQQRVTVGCFAMNFVMTLSCWSHEKAMEREIWRDASSVGLESMLFIHYFIKPEMGFVYS